MEFKDRLREEMLAQGFNNTTLAGRVDVSDSTILRWVNGERKPRALEAQRLAHALGVRVEWLISDTGAKHIEIPAAAKPELWVEGLRGSAALERVLTRYAWPSKNFDVVAADWAVARAREESFADGKDRPESVWEGRLGQLYREKTKGSKLVERRQSHNLNEPSSEFAANKAKKLKR